MELYQLANQLYKKWDLITNVSGYAIVRNKQGTVKFGIAIDGLGLDGSGLYIVPDAAELTMCRFCDCLLNKATTEEEFQESFLYRGATQIAFDRWSQIDWELKKVLMAAGLRRTKKDATVPIIMTKRYFEFETSLVHGERRLFTERVLKILLEGDNFKVIIDSIKNNHTDLLPVVIHNQRTKECTDSGKVMEFAALDKDFFFQPYFGTVLPEETLSEFEWHRILRNIKGFRPIPIEVQVGIVSPAVMMEVNAPIPLLFQVCFQDSMSFAPFDYEISNFQYPFLQNRLLVMCEEQKVRPSKIIVKGNLPHVVKNQLTPLANHLRIPIEISDKPGVLESILSEIEMDSMEETEEVQLQFERFLERLEQFPVKKQEEILKKMVSQEMSSEELEELAKEFGLFEDE